MNTAKRDGVLDHDRPYPCSVLPSALGRQSHLHAVFKVTNSALQEFEEHGITYEKIKCVGMEIPSEEIVERYVASMTTKPTHNNSNNKQTNKQTSKTKRNWGKELY